MMMAAVVAIPPTSMMDIPDASAARKRRREILSSQRQALEVSTPAAPNSELISSFTTSFANEEGHSNSRKARRVSDCSEPEPDKSATATIKMTVNTISSIKKKLSSSSTKKKPQMKYDPDVPMTKEEAAVWRREQRRKRNRESAALSRQRQRDRIGDLEVEVDEWKTKVENIMERIKKLEEESGIDSRTLVPEPLPRPPKQEREQEIPEQSLEFEVIDNNDTDTNQSSKFVSPPASPGHSSSFSEEDESMEASPIASSDAKTVVDAVVDQVLMGIESYEHEFTDNMISRHAVKISPVAPALPFLPKSEDSISALLPSPETCLSGDVAPDNCNSSINNNTINKKKRMTLVPKPATAPTTLDPIDSSLFPVKEEDKLPVLLTDEENEDEFGEFLLDAVQWL